MQEKQPKWAWWVVGILVPIAVAVTPILLKDRLPTGKEPTTEPRPSPSDGVAAETQDAVAASVANPKVLAPLPIDSRDKSESQENARRVALDARQRGETQIEQTSIYRLENGEVSTVQDTSISLSINFDHILGRGVATLVIAPGEGESQRVPIMNAGTTTSVTIKNDEFNITVLAIDWVAKKIVLKIAKGPPN